MPPRVPKADTGPVADLVFVFATVL